MTISCNRQEFDKALKEFLDALPTASQESAENGFKCLSIMYLNLEGTNADLVMSSQKLDWAGRKMEEQYFLTLD